MNTILSIFGKSPLQPIVAHMDLVTACVEQIPALFKALEAEDYETVNDLSKQISKQEHKADLAKNDIRNHLPKSLLLSIDRGHLLEILGIQDSIADQAEDVAVLLTFKDLKMPPLIRKEFYEFLEKNLETFEEAKAVMHELHSLMESSFGGIEATKVQEMVHKVAEKEHETDLLQRALTKKLFDAEEELSYASFLLWEKVITALAGISNLSEKLGNRIRMILILK